MLLQKQTATIGSGVAVSNIVALGEGAMVGIVMPAAWTAAALTFLGSPDGVTFTNIFDTTTERNFAVAVDRFLSLTHTDWLAFKFIKIRSGTTGTPVNQAASRALTVISRKFQ